MSVQDILLVRGLLQRQRDFLIHFEKVHEKVESDIYEGILLSQKSEEKVRRGRNSGREVAKLFPHVRSFYQHITLLKRETFLSFAMKSEVTFLSEMMLKLKAGRLSRAASIALLALSREEKSPWTKGTFGALGGGSAASTTTRLYLSLP